MRRLLGTAAAVMTMAASSSAAADNIETAKDVRCILAIAMLVGQDPESQMAQEAAPGMLYFLGRVQGRDPGLDLEYELRALAPKMTAAMWQDDLGRCGRMLIGTGAELKSIGKSMQERPDLKGAPQG